MRLIIILIVLYVEKALAQGNYSQAISQTQRALLEYPSIKSKVRHLERRLINYIPIEKEYVVFAGSAGMAVVRGRLETKPIKNLDMDLLGGRARPDIFYNFKGEDKGAYFNITWGW